MRTRGLSRPLRIPLSRSRVSHLAESFGSVLTHLSGTFSTRGRFITDTTRRLHAPLTMVRAGLRIFCGGPRRTPRRCSELFAVLRRRAKQLSRLTRVLLSVANLRAMRHSSAVSLTTLARRIFYSLSPITRGRRVQLVRARNSYAIANDCVLLCQTICGLIRGTVGCGQPSNSIAMGVRSTRSTILRMASANVNVSPSGRGGVFSPFCHISGSHDHTVNNTNLKLTLMDRVTERRGNRMGMARDDRGNDAVTLVLPMAVLWVG